MILFLLAPEEGDVSAAGGDGNADAELADTSARVDATTEGLEGELGGGGRSTGGSTGGAA